jgi:hypothetical protein
MREDIIMVGFLKEYKEGPCQVFFVRLRITLTPHLVVTPFVDTIW